jgi:hypothetical protein
LEGETHWVSQGVANEMSLVDTDLTNFFALKNSDMDCGKSKWNWNWTKAAKKEYFATKKDDDTFLQ